MAAMFVPRSLKRKETKEPHCPKKSNSSHDKKTMKKLKVELIDERASASLDSLQAINTTVISSSGPTNQTCTEDQNNSNEDNSDDEEEVVSFSKNQRWPTPGEPVCVVCGRYGAYIVDQTDNDVCSLECKARHLKDLTGKKAKDLLDDISLESDLRHKRVDNGEAVTKTITLDDGFVQTSRVLEFNFHYKEHPFISELSMNQVDDIRSNLNIKVKGERVSKPILEFQHCQLAETLNKNLAHFDYVAPTPVQMQVIPVGLNSRDVLACAQTGSGKTASFLVPMVQIIYSEIEWSFQNRRIFNMNNPLGLILAPTRELCMQIEKQAKELMQGLPIMKTALLVGGLPLPPQLHRLRSGVQIIVATPGRLQEILAQSGTNLSSIKLFVLDEVDTMLQMGFEHQVQHVVDKLPKEKQTMMFSATIPSSIEHMATKLLVNPVYISVGSPSAPNASVKQIVLWVEDKSKKKRLFSILQDTRHFKPPVVVFVDSKMGADMLADAVQQVCQVPCISMHGDKSQSERSKVLESFLAGDYPVLVCTSLLGRGIDLPHVSQSKSNGVTCLVPSLELQHEDDFLQQLVEEIVKKLISLHALAIQVINFDMPSSVEEYIHQVGRAGRLGKTGWALTFINNTNKSVFLDLVETLQPLGVKLPEELQNSPYLLQQKQCINGSSRKRKHKDTLLTHANLMDLIKRNSTRRKMLS